MILFLTNKKKQLAYMKNKEKVLFLLLKKMSRERQKSIWLVSHRDELAGRVENILKVVKENGFTSYSTDIDLA